MKIILIGYSCSYKSSAGKILAEKRGLDFIDVDEQISRTYGEDVTDIFAKYGESEFRKRESAVLSNIAEGRNFVVACGGGSVLCGNFADVCRGAVVVWLTSSVDTVMSRLGEVHRPLSDGLSKEELAKKIKERSAYYSRYANLTVATDSLTAAEAADRIMFAIQAK